MSAPLFSHSAGRLTLTLRKFTFVLSRNHKSPFLITPCLPSTGKYYGGQMGTLNIYLHLQSLIYKKGLLYYLESWGFSPQSISKEGLISTNHLSHGGQKLLICDEDFYTTNQVLKKDYLSLVLLKKNTGLNSSKISEQGICGAFDTRISPAELQMAIRHIQTGGRFIQTGVFDLPETKSAIHRATELTVLSDLTTREREVLRHIANELTNKEIAKLLFISPRTVETHRRNLIQKMKVKNSVGLVKAYLKARSIA